MKSPIQRIDFDPSIKEHRDALLKFINEGKWDLHFNLKYPYKELPYQLYIELIKYYHGKEA